MNLERFVSPHRRSVELAQVSVAYIMNAIRHFEEATTGAASSSSSSSVVDTAETRSNKSNPSALPLPFLLREESLAAGGVDVQSCLHFLFDLYSQWLRQEGSPGPGPGSASGEGPPLVVLTEIVRSMLILSDLFTETKWEKSLKRL